MVVVIGVGVGAAVDVAKLFGSITKVCSFEVAAAAAGVRMCQFWPQWLPLAQTQTHFYLLPTMQSLLLPADGLLGPQRPLVTRNHLFRELFAATAAVAAHFLIVTRVGSLFIASCSC